MVEDDDVQSPLFTEIVVAAGAPVLPLPHLGAAPLLPHGLGVVKTLALLSIVLQCEVTIIT